MSDQTVDLSHTDCLLLSSAVSRIDTLCKLWVSENKLMYIFDNNKQCIRIVGITDFVGSKIV